MKTKGRLNGEIDPARIVVLLGLTVGLGVAVHESFFLFAGMIAISTVMAAIVHQIHDRAGRTRLEQS